MDSPSPIVGILGGVAAQLIVRVRVSGAPICNGALAAIIIRRPSDRRDFVEFFIYCSEFWINKLTQITSLELDFGKLGAGHAFTWLHVAKLIAQLKKRDSVEHGTALGRDLRGGMATASNSRQIDVFKTTFHGAEAVGRILFG